MSSRPIEWFYKLYEYVKGQIKPFSTTLKNLDVVPDQNKNLVSSSKQQVYFPSNTKLVKSITSGLTDDLPAIVFLHEELFKLLSANKELLAWVTENFEIIDFSISAYIGNSLMPWLYEHVEQLNEKSLLSCVQLILEYWVDITPEDREIIGENCPVLLDDGGIVNIDDLKGIELLVPRSMDKENGWQLILQTKDDFEHEDILSDKYINIVESHAGSREDFFTIIKAQKFPDLKEYILKFNSYENSLYIKYASDEFESFDEEFTDDDYSRPKIKCWMPPTFFMNDSKRKNKKSRGAFLKWLEWMVDGRLEILRYGEISWFRYNDKSKNNDSGLYYYLTNIPWIKTTKGLKVSGEVFCKTKQISEMFGNRLAYLKDDISPELCDFLGIKTEATTETVLDLLKELSKHSKADLKLIKQLHWCPVNFTAEPTDFHGATIAPQVRT